MKQAYDSEMRAIQDMRRTTKIAIGLTAFLVGLCLSRFIDPGGYLLITAISLIAICIRKNTYVHIAGIIALGIALGLWRGSVFMDRLNVYQDLNKQKVTIRAMAVNDAVYADKGQLAFDVGSVSLLHPYNQILEGKIGVKGYGESMIYRGDTVLVSAKMYPTRGSKQASLGFAEIDRVQVGLSPIDSIRRQFAAGLQSVVPEPLGSLGLGILIGQRTTLPKSINDQLSTVGLTHIVAVSGYNLTILVMAVHHLTKNRSKYQSTITSVFLIGLFLLITGSSASIVRAALVSSLGLWAWYYGRQFRPTVLILLAAVITAGWFPPYIWSDIGWHLSFLAFAGILIVAPLITSRFRGAKQTKILSLILIETFAAQLLTLPIIMYIFGKLSLVSIFSNMLIVPLVPLAMLLSFVAGLAGMIIPSFAGWFAWPATILLTYMLDIVNLLSKIPLASVGQKIGTLQMVILYLIILIVAMVWWRKSLQADKIKKLNPKFDVQKQLI